MIFVNVLCGSIITPVIDATLIPFQMACIRASRMNNEMGNCLKFGKIQYLPS